METQQETKVSKRVARGKHLGRRYCKRHGLVYKPLYKPTGRWKPKAMVYPYTFDHPGVPA